MPGAGLSCPNRRKAPPDTPAFQPYWGKPAVRNERGDRGNVGIIRSPVRASILPNSGLGVSGGMPESQAPGRTAAPADSRCEVEAPLTLRHAGGLIPVFAWLLVQGT